MLNMMLLLAVLLWAAVALAEAAAAAAIPTTVVVGSNASLPERHAAAELTRVLANISSSSSFTTAATTVVTAAATPPSLGNASIIAVGWQASTTMGFPPAKLAKLGREGFVVSTQKADGVPPGSLVLSGGNGAPRGTLYAVNRFLEVLGVHYLAQDTTIFPASLPAALPALDTYFVPTMEYRDQFEYPLMQGSNASLDLNVHLGLTINADHPERGAASIYAPPSFVHTSYALLCPPGSNSSTCPTTGGHGIPTQLFHDHREWFWPPAPAGPGYGQLCWSNTSLQQFMTNQVKSYLASAPNATIISVSQNDNYAQCGTPEEKAINAAEGTAGGALFRAVNVIADAIATDFPQVAVDTLAYQWSRPAPKITKPKPNVIIRLCSIECNFAEPLDSPSNVAFQHDMSNWALASNRTYIVSDDDSLFPSQIYIVPQLLNSLMFIMRICAVELHNKLRGLPGAFPQLLQPWRRRSLPCQEWCARLVPRGELLRAGWRHGRAQGLPTWAADV